MRSPSNSILPVVLLLVPAVCGADAGIPVGTYSFMWSVLFLVPVVLAEAWVLRGDLKLSYLRALGTTGPSNILSTLAGFVVALATFPLMAAEGAVTDALTLLLFVPLFYLSRSIEFAYSKRSLDTVDPSDLERSIHRANLVSYFMLSVFVISRFLKSWYVNGTIIP
jgi:hypothetical protein